MKIFSRTIITMIIVSMMLPVFMVFAEPNTSEKTDMRGVWVSTVVNIDYPKKATIDVEVLKSEALRILDNAKDMGMNAVFLQVRPSSDAIYKSEYFPWSKYLTGTQGLAPADNFDPLEFWITEAHKRGIELHAWLNPYRVTKQSGKEPAHDFASLAPNNPAKLHPEWVVKHTDGNLYYNPGIPEVRKLVIDGITEIIKNYDVDGIHFDDYFYPGMSFADSDTYKTYGTGYTNINDWRRANVDILIRDLSQVIKAESKDVSFGISPFGIWANKTSSPLGSDTKGNQSFSSHYADTRKWVKEGWLDYIAPQIYWNIGYTVADYSKIVAWWEDVVKDTGVDLYIGQAAYKSNNGTLANAWYGVAEIEKQLQLNAKSKEVDGSIFFSYKSFVDRPSLAAVVKGFYQQKDGITASIPVNVARPTTSLKTTLNQFFITGSSDPSKPLLLNGKPVEGRSKNGYFGVLVPLQAGQNILTFAQDGTYTTRSIYREIASTVVAKMSAEEIPASSVYPQTQEYRSPGEKITFTCQAPYGSLVTVKLGTETYPMQPANKKPAGTGLYADKYTYVYTIPNYEGASKVVDLGAPEYIMYNGGPAKARKAPGTISVIMKNTAFYAEVNKSVINTYQTPTTADGAAYELYSGMVDYITAITGNYIRLSSGLYVNKNDVKTYTSDMQLRSVVTNAAYITGEKWDSLKLDLSGIPAAISAFDGTSLKISISKAYATALPVLPENTPFSKIELFTDDDKAQYVLTMKSDQKIEGYYIEQTAAGLNLNVKRPVKLTEGIQPLLGITIMLDPGHGGSDPGAIGPLGLKYPEKTINLNTALKTKTELEKLGAVVLMTRDTDKDVTLDERLTASRNAKPDMFISIHANSMGDNVDISKVDGFSVFYKEKLAGPLADMVFNNTLSSLSRNNKGLHVRNLYVTRGNWTPSILLESGFIPNPNEFEWLIDENEQLRLAKSLSEAVMKYLTPKNITPDVIQ
ncbi:MAG: hypothetical protein K0S75_335 [Clostridia bacterium]|nr:hypothetical protein [Clostridia bacterium]